MTGVRNETSKAFDNIIDTMTCVDGGKRALRFMEVIREIDSCAEEGDLHAQEVINVMLRFSKLIDIACNK
jgi:hypothetical protein